MNPKQDISAARTPEDLERKYHLGKRFRQIAQTEAEQGRLIAELTKLVVDLFQLTETSDISALMEAAQLANTAAQTANASAAAAQEVADAVTQEVNQLKDHIDTFIVFGEENTSESTKIIIPNEYNQVTIPTMEDFGTLESKIDKKYEIIKTVTIDAGNYGKAIDIHTDEMGDPFELMAAVVKFECKAAEASKYVIVRVYSNNNQIFYEAPTVIQTYDAIGFVNVWLDHGVWRSTYANGVRLSSPYTATYSKLTNQFCYFQSQYHCISKVMISLADISIPIGSKITVFGQRM